MTIEEKARTIIESIAVKEVHDLAWDVIKLTKKIKELDLFMADIDVPYVHRKQIKDWFKE